LQSLSQMTLRKSLTEALLHKLHMVWLLCCLHVCFNVGTGSIHMAIAPAMLHSLCNGCKEAGPHESYYTKIAT
jgi:hypothetical protein